MKSTGCMEEWECVISFLIMHYVPDLTPAKECWFAPFAFIIESNRSGQLDGPLLMGCVELFVLRTIERYAFIYLRQICKNQASRLVNGIQSLSFCRSFCISNSVCFGLLSKTIDYSKKLNKHYWAKHRKDQDGST